jgi:hypothetical protein
VCRARAACNESLLRGSDRLSIQISEQERQPGCRYLHGEKAGVPGMESNQIGWASAARLTFANIFDQAPGSQIVHYVRDGGRAETGGARQIGSRTRACVSRCAARKACP